MAEQVRKTNFSPEMTVELLQASRDFMNLRDIFEQPVNHSETDTVLELERTRHVISHSLAVGQGPLSVEVTRPIREFADTARWITSIAYRSMETPNGLALGHITLYREGSPIANGLLPGNDEELLRTVVIDLSAQQA